MADIGALICGKYRIVKEIGRGGMSVVYLSLDLRLNKYWAIKEIKREADGKIKASRNEGLPAEVEIMKNLDHSALPRIVDITEDREAVFIVMDYVEGISLKKLLNESGAQAAETVLLWGRQLAEALRYLHTRNPPVIYRDLKPSNIILKPEGDIKLIDFGIAEKYTGRSGGDSSAFGTKGYAAPEQYGGEADERSDIFSLGMTLKQLLAGDRVLDTADNTIKRGRRSALSEGLEMIIGKCVRVLPEDRYQSCEELLSDLKAPELLVKEREDTKRTKLRTFKLTLILGFVLVVLAICGRRIAFVKKNEAYETLVSTSTAMALEIKIEKYIKAIDIYPERAEAYLKLLEAYEDNGSFGEDEDSLFLALYNANKDNFDVSSVHTAMLNYKAGLMYFNFYSEQAGSYSFSERVQKAYPFFAANYENETLTDNFAYSEVSNAYYNICLFYKNFILSSAELKEAADEDYEKLMVAAWSIISGTEGIAETNVYDRLVVLNGVFMLLYDRRLALASAGIEKEEVIKMIDEIYTLAVSGEVNKEQTKMLREEIEENYEKYKRAVIRAYEILNSES